MLICLEWWGLQMTIDGSPDVYIGAVAVLPSILTSQGRIKLPQVLRQVIHGQGLEGHILASFPQVIWKWWNSINSTCIRQSITIIFLLYLKLLSSPLKNCKRERERYPHWHFYLFFVFFLLHFFSIVSCVGLISYYDIPLSPISFTRQYHIGQLIIIHIMQTYLFILVSLSIQPAMPGQIRHPHRLLVTSAKHFSTSVSFLIQQEVAAVSLLSDVDIITQGAHGMMITTLLRKTTLSCHFRVIMTLFLRLTFWSSIWHSCIPTQPFIIISVFYFHNLVHI